MANKDIFGIREKKDKTAVSSHPVPQLAEAHEESVGQRLRPTRELKKRVISTPFGQLQRTIRKDAEAVEPPTDMPNNRVEEPKKKKEE